jgi:hypothetical protein
LKIWEYTQTERIVARLNGAKIGHTLN